MLPAVKVEHLWKEYVVGQSHDRHATFYDTLSNALKAPFRKRDETLADPTKFWALNDVSFDVEPGEVVGIIGRNGAGKSTLLKVLSRITAPTKGRVEVRGRLASLLEVGTGFHGELSGRENIFLNGAILGMSRKDIAKKFDEIVAFAEVEKFIDTPVKRYSSGMYVRLAFAVAAHLDCDVLIVDEVLSVGDSAFQEKCMAKMGDLSQGGRTVLFVSHNHAAMGKLCQRGVVLQFGRRMYDGSISEAMHFYNRSTRTSSIGLSATLSGDLQRAVTFQQLTINEAAIAPEHPISPAAPVVFKLRAVSSIPLDEFRVTFCITRHGDTLLGLHDALTPNTQPLGFFESTVVVPAFTLPPGDYGVDLNAYSNRNGQWMLAKGVAQFSIALEWHEGYEPSHAMGAFNLATPGTRVQLGGQIA